MNGTIFCCTQDPAGRHGWGNRPGGVAMSYPTKIEPIRPILVPDCQGALLGMGVKREKEEKVMCHGVAGTDTLILKKQVCPSRDEQDERADRGRTDGLSLPAIQPSQVQDAVYIILGSTSTQFPLCGGAERGGGGEREHGRRTTRHIDNEGIKANCFYSPQKNHEEGDVYP